MNPEQLQQARHSCAHLLAAAVKQIWPGAKNAIGPAIENGFYQDFDMGDVALSDADLPKIEDKMRELVKTWGPFVVREVPVEQARQDFADNPYKLELIEEFAEGGKKITENNPGNFLDLCKGGHSADPQKELRHFKLLSVAGAYWRGSEKNKMLTRIYGTVFPTKDELQKYLHMLEEAKKRDHRKLGKELDLFVFSDLVGSGLPMFTPKGTVLRDKLAEFSNELRLRIGYEKVWIPHVTKRELYETSGHWAKFGDELFLVTSQETSDKLVMKPMNCPHHTRIYASRPRSYRDLPIRYLETTTVYRDEKTGELAGLNRVRSITQDDSHAFAREDQLESEINNLLAAANELYTTVGMELRVRLSYRDDSDAYLGSPELWASAEKQLKNAVVQNRLNYFEQSGEAAFYGPKIDFMATDAIGREHQVATVQLDFVQPERFGLEYTGEDGSAKRPIMIHCALLGSIERFLSVYIEHTAGVFPVWLAPVQAALLPVSEKHAAGAQKIASELRGAGIRVEVDEADETIGKKVRNAAKQKIPYIVVLGDRELSGEWTVRVRGQEEQLNLSKDDFVIKIQKEIRERS